MNTGNWPTGKIQTSLGEIEYALTTADHVCLTTSDIVVNTVPHKAMLLLYRAKGGGWSLRDYTGLAVYRLDNGKDPSGAARDKIQKVFTDAWANTITEDLRVEAERDHLIDQIAESEAIIATKEEEIRDEKNTLRNLRMRQAIIRSVSPKETP